MDIESRVGASDDFTGQDKNRRQVRGRQVPVRLLPEVL
jgi:hypothetical protein